VIPARIRRAYSGVIEQPNAGQLRESKPVRRTAVVDQSITDEQVLSMVF